MADEKKTTKTEGKKAISKKRIIIAVVICVLFLCGLCSYAGNLIDDTDTDQNKKPPVEVKEEIVGDIKEDEARHWTEGDVKSLKEAEELYNNIIEGLKFLRDEAGSITQTQYEKGVEFETKLYQEFLKEFNEKVKETSIINYEIIEGELTDSPKIEGLSVLISPDDVSKENIINLIKHITEGKIQVSLSVYQDKKAIGITDWTEENEIIFDKGYLAYYVKGSISNEIRWMQGIGLLEDLQGTKTELR